jgi:hypothetical protein
MPAAKPPSGHVEAAVIAERYAAVSGFAQIAPSNYADQSKIDVVYEAGGRDADQARIVLKDYDTMRYATAAVGAYNPAESRWRFFPEFVEDGQQQGLRRLYSYLGPLASNEAIAKGMRTRTPVADPYHTTTRKVRSALRQQLKGFNVTGLMQRPEAEAQVFHLDHAPGGAVVAVDGGSMVIPTLNPSGYEYSQVERVAPDETITTPTALVRRASELTVLCVNVLLEDPENEGHTIRGLRQLVVASRADGDSELWLPNSSVITQDEWQETFQPILGTLQAADQRYPYFSPMLASIAYNTIDSKPV